MKLTDKACRSASVDEGKKLKKLSDGFGLFLEVKENGSKHWKQKYRFLGKEKKISYGPYPKVTLAEAREKRDVTLKLLREGINPQEERNAKKREQYLNAENTFENIAREWFDVYKSEVKDKTAQTTWGRLERDVLPLVGNRPIKDINAPEIVSLLKRIEARGAHELAHRAMNHIGQVLRYALATGRAERDFTTDLKGLLKQPKTKHHAAIEPREIPDFLHTLHKNDARLFPQTRIAVEFLMLTFVRTNEMIAAKWSEFDLKDRMWTIPAERMKMGSPHLVPLSKQIMELLHELQELNVTNSEWVFPSKAGPRKHMSNNTVLGALKRMGYQGRMTGHGFRALAMTTLKERLNVRHEVIDRQLAHAHRNSVTAAYDRAKFLPQRIQMMQDWADYLDDLCRPDKVIQIKVASSK
jgi:integrase